MDPEYGRIIFKDQRLEFAFDGKIWIPSGSGPQLYIKFVQSFSL